MQQKVQVKLVFYTAKQFMQLETKAKLQFDVPTYVLWKYFVQRYVWL